MAFMFAMELQGTSYAQSICQPLASGDRVSLSQPFQPPILKGIKVYPDDPLRFDFILNKGDAQLTDEQVKTDSHRLIKYFLASLTVPEKDLWVNLSPYEKDRIVPDAFGQTEMGRDLLAQDYVLKQITASVIYPEDSLGKAFWDKVYSEALKRYGTTDVPVDTFNKVWIIPEKAIVYENKEAAFVVESRLKVMLEEDYFALEKNTRDKEQSRILQTTNKLGSEVIREVVIPVLEKEVNEGRNFAQLRQIYNSLILATWYKKRMRDSILDQVYTDKNKVVGINIPACGPTACLDTEKIYQQYLETFKRGVYNYIKEEQDPGSQQLIARRYFSGGALFTGLAMKSALHIEDMRNVKDLPESAGEIIVSAVISDAAMAAAQHKQSPPDILVDDPILNDQTERSRIVWGEKRKVLFSITPEQMIIAYKHKGDAVKKFEEDGLKVVIGLPDDEQGLVILSEFETPLEWIRKKGFQSQPEVTYEILFHSLDEGPQLTEEMLEHHFVDVPDIAVEWSRANDLQEPYYRLVLMTKAGNVTSAIDWIQSQGYSVIHKTRVSFGLSRLSSGQDEQKSRKMTWKELIDFMRALGVNEFKDMNPLYKKTIEEEQIDRKILEESLKKEDFIKDVFETFFARPDLNLSDISGYDIWYLGEGGFRRVYQVNLRIASEPEDYSFVFKALKDDVKYSDSGFVYNEKYVREIESVLSRIRQKELGLYPPFLSHQVVDDAKGRKRIVIAEGFVPVEPVLEDKAIRLALEAYLKMYLIFEGKLFLVDPKLANINPIKNHTGQEVATIIDLDNMYGPLIRAEHRVYAEDEDDGIPGFEVTPINNLLSFGFKSEDIIDVAYDIFGVEGTEAFAREYLFRMMYFPTWQSKIFKEVWSRRLLPSRTTVGKRPLSFTADPVNITINNLRRKVPATASLEAVLFDMNISPEDNLIIEFNGRKIADEKTGWIHNAFKMPVADLLTADIGEPGTAEIHIKFFSERLNVQKLDFFHTSLEQQGFYEYLNILIKDLKNFQKVLGYATEHNQKLKAAFNILSILLNNQETLRRDGEIMKDAELYLLSHQQFRKLETSAKRIDYRNKGDRREAMLECLERVKKGYEEILDIYDKVSSDVNAGIQDIRTDYSDEARSAQDIDSAMALGKGGIDLTSAKRGLQIQDRTVENNPHMDPISFEQLHNASGFVPVITGIQPLINLRRFFEITVSQ